ncbi:hemagglutinin [Borealpox virus]|nr:hemagglutinin [Alaskapox virus]
MTRTAILLSLISLVYANTHHKTQITKKVGEDATLSCNRNDTNDYLVMSAWYKEPESIILLASKSDVLYFDNYNENKISYDSPYDDLASIITIKSLTSSDAGTYICTFFMTSLTNDTDKIDHEEYFIDLIVNTDNESTIDLILSGYTHLPEKNANATISPEQLNDNNCTNVSDVGTPESVTTLAETPESVTTLAETPESVTTLAETPESVTTLAETPESVTTLAETPESVTTLAETPESVTTLAETPESVTTLAETPESVTTLAETPESVTTLAETPESVTTLAETPESVTTLAETPESVTDANTVDDGRGGSDHIDVATKVPNTDTESYTVPPTTVESITKSTGTYSTRDYVEIFGITALVLLSMIAIFCITYYICNKRSSKYKTEHTV